MIMQTRGAKQENKKQKTKMDTADMEIEYNMKVVSQSTIGKMDFIVNGAETNG